MAKPSLSGPGLSLGPSMSLSECRQIKKGGKKKKKNTFIFKGSVTTHLSPETSTCILHTMFSLVKPIYGFTLLLSCNSSLGTSVEAPFPSAR